MGAMVGKVKIVQASMFVRKVKLMPSVFLAHAKTLERSQAKYPIRRVVCKAFTIPQNYLDISVLATCSCNNGIRSRTVVCMYKVGTGSVLRTTDTDQHGTGQLDRVSSVDDRG